MFNKINIKILQNNALLTNNVWNNLVATNNKLGLFPSVFQVLFLNIWRLNNSNKNVSSSTTDPSSTGETKQNKTAIQCNRKLAKSDKQAGEIVHPTPTCSCLLILELGQSLNALLNYWSSNLSLLLSSLRQSMTFRVLWWFICKSLSATLSIP